jgi:hypothetical protein
MIFREITNMEKVFNFKLVFTLLLLVMGNSLVCPVHAQEWSNSVRAFTPDSSGVTAVTGTTTAGEIFDAQQASDASQPASCNARNPESVLSPCCVKELSIGRADCKKASTAAGGTSRVQTCDNGYTLVSEAGALGLLCDDIKCKAATDQGNIILKAEYNSDKKQFEEWFSGEGLFLKSSGKKIPCKVGDMLPFVANSAAIQQFEKVTGCDTTDGSFCQVKCAKSDKTITAVFKDPNAKDVSTPKIACRETDALCGVHAPCCEANDECQAFSFDSRGRLLYYCKPARRIGVNTNTNSTTPTTTNSSTTGGGGGGSTTSSNCAATGEYLSPFITRCCETTAIAYCPASPGRCLVTCPTGGSGSGGGNGGGSGGTGGGSGTTPGYCAPIANLGCKQQPKEICIRSIGCNWVAGS